MRSAGSKESEHLAGPKTHGQTHALAEKSLRLGFQILKDRVRIRTVHVTLLEEREGDAVVALADGAGRLVVLRVLVAELIGGETEHDKALVLVLLVD